LCLNITDASFPVNAFVRMNARSPGMSPCRLPLRRAGPVPRGADALQRGATGCAARHRRAVAAADSARIRGVGPEAALTIQFGEQAVARHEFVVPALLDEPAVLEHQDEIGFAHRG
jgi:hypothetical protein